jgi:hypothetical protein
MTKSLRITEDSWNIVRDDLRKKYGDSIMINMVMKKKLNFTRRYGEYDFPHRYIYIDFFAEQSKTLFLLKYGEIINNDFII